MIDFLKAGLVYVPAYGIGRYLSGLSDDPTIIFATGWVVGAAAITIRVFGPKWIRGADFLHRDWR